jgi:hypothetical protein
LPRPRVHAGPPRQQRSPGKHVACPGEGVGHQGSCQRPCHNTITALARPPMAQLLWANAGYSDKVTGNDEHNNKASPATDCDCVMTGKMPVCDAGAVRVCRGWQHQCYKGKNIRVTRVTMLALLRQRQWRGAGNDASACCNCFVTGQMPGCDAGGKAKAMRTKMPAQQGQKCPCNTAMMLAQCQ